MSLKTGGEYIDSVRKMKTKVYVFGERADNIVDHPMLRVPCQNIAKLYDIVLEPKNKEG